MNLINLCGFGNTGCTSQVDVLCDYEGVFGVLSPPNQSIDGKSAFHEIGVLKCQYSFGGVVIAKIHGQTSLPNKKELENSLMGVMPSDTAQLSFVAKLHLDMRRLLNVQYGEEYFYVVKDSLASLPDDFNCIDIDNTVLLFRDAFAIWINGILKIISENSLLLNRNSGAEKISVLGLKNDPPGAFPLLASFIPNGSTSAILRDPRDTTYDFNRHYKLGHTHESVVKHCRHYNAQLNSARDQINRFYDLIKGCYFVHEFEPFINDISYRQKYVEKMIGTKSKLRNHFDSVKSSKNIGHYINMDLGMIKYIEESCLSNYLEFIEFLDRKDLLLKKT